MTGDNEDTVVYDDTLQEWADIMEEVGYPPSEGPEA